LRVAVVLFLTLVAICVLSFIFLVPQIHRGPK
jgi:hypothetical protein